MALRFYGAAALVLLFVVLAEAAVSYTYPPPPYVYASPPPPPYVHSSPPPPPYVYSSPPPPPYVHSSPPPPPYIHASPPPPPPYVHATPSPSPAQPHGKKVKCMNKGYPSCYKQQFTCPASCAYSCEVDCVTCKPVCSCDKPGTVCQDPRFIGSDGITFYFHGKKDQDFCLVTDSNLHINAHFIGKRSSNMGRDFTWVQSLGILFNNHRLYIAAQKTTTWNDVNDRLALSLDDEPIFLPEGEGSKWVSSKSGVTITRSQSTNGVIIEAEGNFKIKAAVVPITQKESRIHNYGITQEDCFAHLDLSFKFYSLGGEVDGVLGQTYASGYTSKIKMGVPMAVVGGEDKFATSSLFATDCAVAKFSGNPNEDAKVDQFPDLNCASGINGRGVVCKR